MGLIIALVVVLLLSAALLAALLFRRRRRQKQVDQVCSSQPHLNMPFPYRPAPSATMVHAGTHPARRLLILFDWQGSCVVQHKTMLEMNGNGHAVPTKSPSSGSGVPHSCSEEESCTSQLSAIKMISSDVSSVAPPANYASLLPLPSLLQRCEHLLLQKATLSSTQAAHSGGEGSDPRASSSGGTSAGQLQALALLSGSGPLSSNGVLSSQRGGSLRSHSGTSLPSGGPSSRGAGTGGTGTGGGLSGPGKHPGHAPSPRCLLEPDCHRRQLTLAWQHTADSASCTQFAASHLKY